MKKQVLFIVIILISNISIFSQGSVTIIDLNGQVAFDQTETAYPPLEFTRTIPVPGLIDLATPKIEQYEEYFRGTHKPRYSWYKFEFEINKKNAQRYAVLKILKSFFNTQIVINGHDVGTYMQGSTPIDADLTAFIKEGNNVLLVRLGDRAWMPKEAATGFDREKYTDIPGIWDDVFIEIAGPIKVHRALVLPSLKNKKVIVKVNLENYVNIVERNMEFAEIDYTLSAVIREKSSLLKITKPYTIQNKIGCQQSKTIEFEIDISNPKSWSPAAPFLYELIIEVTADRKFFPLYGNTESIKPKDNQSWIGDKDIKVITFGMRDFESVGKAFHLNGSPINLYGSTITLNRFFEDRDRAHLPWDRAWVEELMVNIPKALRWNFFRVSIGLLPKFWYELADKHGILIQNEYLMWNLRGRPSGYQKEYTDWIWSDGNHPSIVIWDALNEQKQDYIGRVLIPELKKLDPTRIWDLGYMKSEEIGKLEVNEIHWYPLAHGWWVNDKWVKEHMPAFRFGKVTKKYDGLAQFDLATTPIIVNEFGWQWQSRNGLKSGVRTFGNFTADDKTPYTTNYESYEPNGKQLYKNRDSYLYFLGDGASAKKRRDFQAYILAIESEILRSTREADGLATFAYLTNNNGYTGDWFKDDIKNLEPTQGLLVQYHTCRPFAVFVDMQDGRYLKKPDTYKRGQNINVKLYGVNDNNEDKKGNLVLKLIGLDGEISTQSISIDIKANWQNCYTVNIELPEKNGGYMLVSELHDETLDDINQVSRRYIKVGTNEIVDWPEYNYLLPKYWKK
ncbi:MAG: sugar-binding domain-containing protein [Saprospiraceae bacterium]